MINQQFLERLIEYSPKLLESLQETTIMMGLATVAALLLGLPLGTTLFLTSSSQSLSESVWARVIHQILNLFVNIIRSFPFLLLVVAMQPIIRQFYGRATGDPVAASFPMMLIAIALYARFVEQSLHDIPKGVSELAESMGASQWELVVKFLYVEARSSLVIGFTTAFVSFLSYSTIMGVTGGGGIGDFAIRYGYQRYETDIMYVAVVVIIIMVQALQWLGFKLARLIDKR
ncbi:methionine ABC transporter permease [Facklamia lactis]|uniref:methionine ABC transporter permease n=1 Tax=Facklamia lactis TaxID=2749967 RepID=UPI0018CE67BB|nr:ABC transporter permease subunit [Facklamia lactis]MBG9981211.1 ABC transporter permease subunit [Facklamia lactis]